MGGRDGHGRGVAISLRMQQVEAIRSVGKSTDIRGIEIIYQCEIDNSLHSDVNEEEGICYVFKVTVTNSIRYC